MGTLSITSALAGHDDICWRPSDLEDVRLARDKFNEIMKKPNKVAYKTLPGGGRGEKITEFDPKARHIVIVDIPVGG